MEGGAPPPRARTGSVHVDFDGHPDPLTEMVASLRAAVSTGEVISASILDTLVAAFEEKKQIAHDLMAHAAGRKAARASALTNTHELAYLADEVAAVRVLAVETLEGLRAAEEACGCVDKICADCGGAPFPTETWCRAVALCERIKSQFTEQGLLDDAGGLWKEKLVSFAPAVGGGGGGGGEPQFRYMPLDPHFKHRTSARMVEQQAVVRSVADFEQLSREPFNAVFAAGTNSGKSFLLCRVAITLVEQQRVNNVFVLSADVDTVVQAGSPYHAVCAAVKAAHGQFKALKFTEKSLADIVDWQEKRRKGAAEGKREFDPVLIVLDDVDDVVRALFIQLLNCRSAFTPHTRTHPCPPPQEKSASLLALFKRGRHINIFLCVLSQTSNRALAPTFKANARFIFFSSLPPFAVRDLSQSMILHPPQKPKAISDWVAAEIGGAEGTPQQHVFALYDSHRRMLWKVKA
jgi:hypothetical protein